MNLAPNLQADMPTATDRARQAILAELLPLQKQAATLREQLTRVESEQIPLEAAMAALDDRPKVQTKPAMKGKKPCAKKADVEAVCHALLTDNESLSLEDLEALAKEKLSREQGFNLSGFGLRFKECLASDAFSASTNGIVTLVKTTQPRVVQSPVDNTTTPAIID